MGDDLGWEAVASEVNMLGFGHGSPNTELFTTKSLSRRYQRLVNALFARDGKLPNDKTALGHNHISIIEHFGTADESLGPDILEFICENAGK